MGSAPGGPRVAVFGPFRFDLSTRELTKNGIPLRLEEKPTALLHHFLTNAGVVVAREDLHALLWPAGVYVDYDHGLNKAVNRLRAVLCDSREEPRYVETLSRKGYRFIAKVEFSAGVGENLPPDPEQFAPHETHPAEPPKRRALDWNWVKAGTFAFVGVLLLSGTSYLLRQRASARVNRQNRDTRLVVLPFENLTGDASQEYFCDGLTEELIAQLGMIDPSRLQVIARATSMHYKRSPMTAAQVGTELKAKYVLSGSVRRAGALYRIAVQLTDSEAQTNLWTGTFDREFKDVLDVQRDVALTLGREVGEAISPAFQHPAFGTQPIHPLAHDAYLRGRFHWSKRTVTDLRDSVDEFQRAISIDPDYAEAHAGLADAYALLASFGAVPFREGYPKAAAEAREALRLDPNSAEAKTSLAFVEAYYDWSFQQAEEDFRAAIRQNPNYVTAHHWYGLFLAQRGRPEEAIAELTTASQLDPLSLTIGVDLGNALTYAGRYADAERQLLKVRALDPSYYGTYGTMSWLYGKWGRLPEADRENEIAKKISGNYIANDNALAYAYAQAGQTSRAREIVARMEKNAREHGDPQPCPLYAYLALKEDAAALDCLDRAIEERSDAIVPLLQDSVFSKAASDPRFKDRLRRAGLLERETASHGMAKPNGS